MESYKTWNEEMAREFSLYKPIMWLIGSWPLDRSKKFATYRALFVTVTQAVMVARLGKEIGYRDGISLEMLIDHFVLTTCGVLTITKILLIRLHRDKLLKNLYSAASDWTYISKPDHRQVMLSYTNLSRFVFFFQMCFSYVIILPLIVGPLLSSVMQPSLPNITLSASPEKEMQVMALPLEMTCPLDAKIACIGIYILQTVQLISTVTGNVGGDVFLFGICMHLCGQLEVFSLELSQFHEGIKNNSTRTKMIVLIERHCLLLNLAKDIVNTLYIILVAQLIVHASLICLIGVQLIWSLTIGNFILTARSITSFNILMIQLFVYSYMGESLSSKTQEISRAIYFSKWYDLPTKIVHDLYFMIARANVPVRIKAGKFYNIDLNSFKNILKASGSYFSVLNIMLTQ